VRTVAESWPSVKTGSISRVPQQDPLKVHTLVSLNSGSGGLHWMSLSVDQGHSAIFNITAFLPNRLAQRRHRHCTKWGQA
jgi:hypothetical protein